MPYGYASSPHPSASRSLVILVIACLSLAAGLVLVGCSLGGANSGDAGTDDARPSGAPSADPTPDVSGEPVTFAAVGDSITEADSPDIADGRVGDRSWVKYASGEEASYVGGWAVSGATTSQMAGGASPIDADVLVILAGTNDSGNGIPFEESAQNLAAIADTVGADRVIVSAIPPQDYNPGAATTYNEALRALASDRGWEFVDAPAGVRQGDTFLPGMTTDGTHPTVEAARIMGQSIRAAVLGD